MPLVHHELCFGCGRTNLFGLLVDVEAAGTGEVSGRCFIKQDHQGSHQGVAHDGVVAAALVEAMALALALSSPSRPGLANGEAPRVRTLQVSYGSTAPVGAFLELTAAAGRVDGAARATARADGHLVATAQGTFG